MGAARIGSRAGAMTVRELIEQVQRSRDPQRLAALVPALQPARYRKAEPLLRQGERWARAFFVERGLLRLHVTGRDGSDFNKSFWPEGTLVLPLTEAMQQQPSLFGLTALEDSVVWQADLAAFTQGLAGHGLWEPLRTELLARLLDMKQQREHDLLMLDGRTRYARFCEQHPQLAARVPLVHLASHLGLTAVSLSRIRRAAKPPVG
jgi:CRP-like cAMP-binding protein